MPIPDLNGTTVMVTGAAGGLGRVICLALLEAGAGVAALDIARGDAAMADLAGQAASRGAGARLHPVRCDVTDANQAEAAVNATVAHFGAVHGLVNVAGLGPQELESNDPGRRLKFYELRVDLLRGRVETNFLGAFIMARAVAPRLVSQKRGKIVNVTTSYGTMVREYLTLYGPSKAALEAATLIWSRDLADSGVTANVLVPGGAADTNMVPLEVEPNRGKLIKPSVMAAPIQWLMSRHADGITGRRFIGKDWDPALDGAVAAQRAGAPAAW
jgi:3-oxoacyl-[acyl-carrier protein] reductase